MTIDASTLASAFNKTPADLVTWTTTIEPDQVEAAYLAVLSNRLDAESVALADAVERIAADLVEMMRGSASYFQTYQTGGTRRRAAKITDLVAKLTHINLQRSNPITADHIPSVLKSLAEAAESLAGWEG